MKKLFCIAVALTLTGCGAMNAYVAASQNVIATDYESAKKNLQDADDHALQTWKDSACNIKLGAVQRNATGAPGVVDAVFKACPVNSIMVINSTNGTMTVTLPQQIAPAPTAAPLTAK